MSDSRQQELQDELSRRQELESELSRRNEGSQPTQMNTGIFNLGSGMPASARNRTGIDAFRDLLGGIATGSQNIASSLLEGGEYITRKGAEKLGRDLGHPVNVPYWNAREFMGLEGNNPINLGKMIASKNPDTASMMIGQFGLPTLAGGPSALRQMATQGAYGASQASPEQTNALGFLPNGRSGAAIESAALTGLPFAIPKIYQIAKNMVGKYASPQKAMNALVENVSGGKNVTENIQELSQRMGYGQKTAREEALIPKREVMSESGNERIFPSQIKGRELTDETSAIFAEHPKDITPDKLKKWKEELRVFYNGKKNVDPAKSIAADDLDRLIEKGEEIFEHPGINENNVSKLEEMLVPEKPVKGEYLKLEKPEKGYSELIRDAHNAYVKNPTFRNSDKLRSRLFKRINELQKRNEARTITDAQESELARLKTSRDSIIKDQERFIEKLPPHLKGKYAEYNKTWREDVRAYSDANKTVKNLKNGYLKNMTPNKITNAMAFPELNTELQRVLKDIGPEGINNIVYNAISKAANPKEMLDIIGKLERDKGFSSYLTPEFRKMAETVRKQARNKNFLTYGGGLAGATLLGSGIYKGGKAEINALTE